MSGNGAGAELALRPEAAVHLANGTVIYFADPAGELAAYVNGGAEPIITLQPLRFGEPPVPGQEAEARGLPGDALYVHRDEVRIIRPLA